MTKQEFHIPIAYGINLSDSSMSVAERKAQETSILDSVINLAQAFGVKDVEIGEIIDAPDGTGKIVTMKGSGTLDSEALFQSLTKAVRDQEM